MMNDLIIFGAGGFGREVAWAVERINAVSPTWNLLGFMDDDESIQGSTINGYTVLGMSCDIGNYPNAYFVVAVGASKKRESIVSYLKASNPTIKFGTVIDSSVEMSDLVAIGEGSIICAHTIVTVNISIGSLCKCIWQYQYWSCCRTWNRSADYSRENRWRLQHCWCWCCDCKGYSF